MGEVYRAYDTRRERVVALKLLRPEVAADPGYRARFQRESRIAARLREPHVIPVHDFGEIDGVLYIDMRLVEGPSLRDVLDANGALAPRRTVSIVGQVAKALDAAHANDLAHRDVKPENVLMTADAFAYLVDFGIAYGGGEASVTKANLIMGSCAYIAPERLKGEPGGPAADVYSLTCLLYECLTGRAPFEGDAQQVMNAHLVLPTPRPSLEQAGISPAFDDVIARGMAKDPADRYASAGAMAAAATSAAQAAVPPGGPPSSLRVPVAPSRPTPTRQYPAAMALPPAAPVPLPVARAGRSRFSRGQVALLATTIVLFGLAALLASVLVVRGGGDATPAQTTTPVTTAPSVVVVSSTSPTSTPTPTINTVEQPRERGPLFPRWHCRGHRCNG
jgi:serine/threonine-protein kinase